MLRRAFTSPSRAAFLQQALTVAGGRQGASPRLQSSSAAEPAVPAQAEADAMIPPTTMHVVDGKEVPYIPELTGKWDDKWREMLRHSNATLPLYGQIIEGTIVHVDKRSVLVDTGFKAHQRFMKRELSPQSLVSRADGSKVEMNDTEFRVGDVLNFAVRNPTTPFGDMQLEVQRYKTYSQLQAVVDELRAAKQSGRAIMGRILNAVNGGYAVGIAGIVAFLPSSRASLNTVKKLGVLQPFFILQLTDGQIPNVVLSDPYPKPRTRRVIHGKLL